jgi:chemotaxis protein methyltransferase CheR
VIARPQESARSAAPSGDREFVFRNEDFRQIAAMLHADSGIFLSEQKESLVYSRLVKRLRALGLSSFKDYCALIADASGVDERQKMLAALTTNVTRFFREPHHFQHLKDVVLPPLLQAAKRGGRVRIWSAGCSKGQEPYSIAMTILSLMPDANSYDIKILATDIDPNVLQEGRDGLYEKSELEDMPKTERSRFFTMANGDPSSWSVSDEMRRLVSFKELNLIAQWPIKGPFDIIFCRNVVIYFNEETQAKIWSRYATLLAPGALLCIGHSERLSGPAASRFKPTGTTMYTHMRDATP